MATYEQPVTRFPRIGEADLRRYADSYAEPAATYLRGLSFEQLRLNLFGGVYGYMSQTPTQNREVLCNTLIRAHKSGKPTYFQWTYPIYGEMKQEVE